MLISLNINDPSPSRCLLVDDKYICYDGVNKLARPGCFRSLAAIYIRMCDAKLKRRPAACSSVRLSDCLLARLSACVSACVQLAAFLETDTGGISPIRCSLACELCLTITSLLGQACDCAYHRRERPSARDTFMYQ